MNRRRYLARGLGLILIAALFQLHLGCKREAPAAITEKRDAVSGMRPKPEPIRIDSKLPEKYQKIQKELAARYPLAKAEWEQEHKDRKELVRPTPAGFKPENTRRRIGLALIAKSPQIHKGANLWYRLELQNLGREPVYWAESPSFFKNGDALALSKFRFHLIPPDGDEIEMSPWKSAPGCGGMGEEFILPGAEKMSPEKLSSALAELTVQANLESGLSVRLQPGETLATRPWRNIDPREYCRRRKRGEIVDFRAPGAFRELVSDTEFDAVGRYKLRIVYTALSPSPPTEEEIQWMISRGIDRERVMKNYEKSVQESLGTVSSNWIEVEVVP